MILQRIARPVAITTVFVGGFALITAVVISAENTRILGLRVDWAQAVWAGWTLSFLVVGALLVTVRPTNPVGWGFLVASASTDLALFGQAYAGRGVFSGDLLPLHGVVAWLTFVVQALTIPAVVVTLAVLPSGRIAGARMRLLLRAVGYYTIVYVAWWSLGPDRLSAGHLATGLGEDAPRIENPLALVRLDGEIAEPITGAITLPLMLVGLAAGFRLFRLRKRGTMVERAQVRWIGLSVLVLPLMFVVGVLLENLAPSNSIGEWIGIMAFAFGLGAIPVAIAMAILRYRLFEIDRLISRTMSYVVVTGLAAGVFALVVVLPASIFGDEGTPRWLIAAATLAAAAVFSPLLRRVQAVVDRRFNRARYDAQLIADGFATRLRDPRELDVVTADLAGTVRSTMHPERIGLWVRA